MLAATHHLSKASKGKRTLLVRLDASAHYLAGVQATLREDVRTIGTEDDHGLDLMPGAEWLLDNYYIISDQITEIRVDLPRGFYAELPKLANSPLHGYPRVYALARALVAHTDSTLYPDSITAFVAAYQQATPDDFPLTLGELWSVPIMLRLSLVETLAHLVRGSTRLRDSISAADRLADRLLAQADQGRVEAGRETRDANRLVGSAISGPEIDRLLSELRIRAAATEHNPHSALRTPQSLSPEFAARLQARLRAQGNDLAPALRWLDNRLADEGTNIEEAVRLDQRRQAAIVASIGNTITSMRRIAAIDWPSFVESLSATEAELRNDPSGAYPNMDFATRDRYRRAVERLARRAHQAEPEVAAAAVAIAARAAGRNGGGRLAHVGYYLIDAGRPALERALGYRANGLEVAARAVQSHALPFYSGLIVGTTAATVAAAAAYARRRGVGPSALAGTAAAVALPASNLAVGLVNYVLTSVIRPYVLPKLALEGGIPADARSFVVIPILLNDEAQLHETLEHLQVLYLANHDPHLHYALLSDFPDAEVEERPGDADLLRRAVSGIEVLNARYGGADRFYLFHRRRCWNPQEGVWMGWERKRGKLLSFNRLILGTGGDDFTTRVGDLSVLPGVRYAITLDADTQLPPGAARRLIGTISHPLNRAELDEDQRVVCGYGILQPRVAVTVTSAAASSFAHIMAGHSGVDPYTTAVSDIYQDLFHTGIYIGKGIYDIAAFQRAVEGRFPENTLLSHDLLEGSYARAGLVSDILLYEDQPSRYPVYAVRQDRWIRGDWQIIRWLLPRVRDAGGDIVRNPLTALARWQIFDNLRRSLSAPASLALLAAGWSTLPGSATVWTGFSMLVRGFPLIANLVGNLPFKPTGTSWSRHIRFLMRETGLNALHLGLSTVLLPHQAEVHLTAIARALARMYITHRRLLAWQTSADVQRSTGNTLPDYIGLMGFASWVLGLGCWALAVGRRETGNGANPLSAIRNPQSAFGVAWAAAPLVAYWVSRRTPDPRRPLKEDERADLRRTARTTWRYFEEFVGPADNWLAPDNYQEDPPTGLAHRTSPTNLSLSLLATLTARDFGYLSTTACVDRLEQQLGAIEHLERFEGHLYNWYDTTNCAPLLPRYISMVDSGNLAAHLIVLKQGLLAYIDTPLVGPELVAGLADTAGLLREVSALSPQLLAPSFLADFEAAQAQVPTDLPGWGRLLADLCDKAAAIRLEVGGQEGTSLESADLRYWASALAEQARAALLDFETLLPWVAPLFAPPPAAAALAEQLLSDEFEYPAIGTLPAPTPLERQSVASNIIWCARRLPAIRHMRSRIRQADLAPAAEQEALDWLDTVHSALTAGWTSGETLARRLRELAGRTGALSDSMRFEFLYDPARRLFAVGYNVTDARRDNSYYDLLASEARLGSYLAVARGDVPAEHWFHLGRALTAVDGTQALVSWTGTMFEYLMPNLVMPAYPGTLLDQTCVAAVQRQHEYGRERRVPWGISESAFNLTDAGKAYQYRAFGVPGLGLKRGLEDDLVIAPYATMLALSVDPPAAVANLRRLAKAGMASRYGYYEAIDYTRGRNDGGKGGIVRTYMVHHQGMSLLSIGNALHGYPLPSLFLAEPLLRASYLLLQERIPQQAPLIEPAEVTGIADRPPRLPSDQDRPGDEVIRFETPDTPQPIAHLLSNGSYTVMLTNSGGGYSEWRPDGGTAAIAVTRRRYDPTRDCWGSFLYLRDMRTGRVWSAGYAPVGGLVSGYGGEWVPEYGAFWRKDEGIETYTRVVVSPEEDVEVRRVTVTNRSNRPREIEVTSYAEVVLTTAAADAAHPAFEKLFVETEFVADPGALLAGRRPRSAGEQHAWLMHILAVEGDSRGELEYETDRARFVGRGRTTADPAALSDSKSAIRNPKALSGTVGAVLDPIISLRRRVRLAPGATARFSFATGVAESREAALALADRYRDTAGGSRAARLAATYSRIQLSRFNFTQPAAMRAIRLAGRVIYPSPALRPSPDILARNTKGQPGLWAYGISGDLPILLVTITDPSQVVLVQETVQAHEYWRSLGFSVDLVILNEYSEGYIQQVHDDIQAVLYHGPAADRLGQPGGVFLVRADVMPEADQILLRTAARAILQGRRGLLNSQLGRTPNTVITHSSKLKTQNSSSPRTPHSAFSEDCREYVIRLESGQHTPAPWINVLANPDFGCLVSESSIGSTWDGNSRENRLTPWSNDPISDPSGDVVYIRDEASGDTWSPTPLPIREREPYTIRHGHGYTIFEHTSHGIEQEMTLFVPPAASLRILRLRLRNLGPANRRLSVTNYIEWVMGVDREPSARFVITGWDADASALVARNPYNNEFADRVAFMAVGQSNRPAPYSYTADRAAFLGRNGRLSAPAALAVAEPLDGRTGAGLDPCGAIRLPLDLPPGETAEVVFLLGEAATADAMHALLTQMREPDAVAGALNAARSGWDDLLARVQVETPDPALDTMLNHWLLYQALACRIWARSAFYQGGGAYGFRDQLQDVLALLNAAPEIARAQILRAAGRQFKAGDVQHWWHPPTGRGVRTHISDDLLWLPFVTALYLEATGDTGLLDESLPFLEAPPIPPSQEDSYSTPAAGNEAGTLYEHCVRAITRGATQGPHGLPLMGSGDWNDGMNRVGNLGTGESVWLAWFLEAVLARFAPIAEARGDAERASWCRAEYDRVKAAINDSGWDGEWFRRAYFDDGALLGSHLNEECRIDSIAQSWAVLSGAGDHERTRQAMASAVEHLVRPDDKLILLLTPAFDKSPLDPGYIKGYIPGVRENGGQYTHAAIWLAFAFAELRDGKRAHDLFAMLNPINHALDPEAVARYKVEPYVIAADVYAQPQHLGRGGWTWYTGSAAWMYRLGLEAILGLHREASDLRLDPTIPPDWSGFRLLYRHGAATYTISVDNSAGVGHGVAEVTLDGEALPEGRIPLDPAPATHDVRVRLASPGT
ncbi:MAG: GH36-type glycosyl hydrolase domain-containing protein [Chloroflexia bacterium]